MALPTVTVTGKFLNPDGTAVAGSISFTLAVPMTDAADNVIVPAGTVTARLDHTGAFSVSLVPSNASGLAPTPVAYTVREAFGPGRTYYVTVPSTPSTSNLADLAPASAAPTPPTVYLQKTNNLSDVGSAATARTNLGLGSIATHGTSEYLTPAQGSAAYAPLTWGMPDADRTTAYKESIYAQITYTTRAAVSLRFDDGRKEDINTVLPLLKARGLVAGFFIPSDYIGAAAGATVDPSTTPAGTTATGNMTVDDLHTMRQAGMQIGSHSHSHSVDPTDPANFIYETVDAQTILQNYKTGATTFTQSGQHFFVDHFAPPGGWSTTYHLDLESKFQTIEGMTAKGAYAAIDGYVNESAMGPNAVTPAYQLPAVRHYGPAHYTGDQSSLASLQGIVDDAIKYGFGCEIVFHSWDIGTASYITLANFTSFLDYLQTKRDAGLITVLTPTALLYAKPDTTRRSLLFDTSLALQATGAYNVWKAVAGSPVIATGGQDGGNLVRCDASNTFAQDMIVEGTRSVRFEVYARSTSGTAQARIIARAYNGAETFQWTNADSGSGGVPVTTTWTKVAVTAGNHPQADHWRFWLLTAASTTVEYSAIRVYKT